MRKACPFEGWNQDAADDAIIERAVAIATRADLWDGALRFAKLAVDKLDQLGQLLFLASTASNNIFASMK